MNRSSLSKENLLRHNQQQQHTQPNGLDFKIEDPNHLFQNIRLNQLFVQPGCIQNRVQTPSSNSLSTSEENPWQQERGRRLSIDKNPRSNVNNSPDLSVEPIRRRFRRIEPFDLEVSSSSDSSTEEAIDTTMLLNAKVTGKDSNGVSTLFDPNNTSLLVSPHIQQPLPKSSISRDLTSSYKLMPDSKNLVHQNSDNEDSLELTVPIVNGRKRKSTPIPQNLNPSLKRTRSAGPRIPSGRIFKTPRLQKPSENKNGQSFDLKFPKIG